MKRNWYKTKPGKGYGWWPSGWRGWAVGITYSTYGFTLTIWFLTRPHLSNFTVIGYLLAMAVGIAALQAVAWMHQAEWRPSQPHDL